MFGKGLLGRSVGILFLCLVPLFAWAVWPVGYPTGVTLNKADKTSPGYTLWAPAPGRDGAGRTADNRYPAYLINMSGEVVHQFYFSSYPFNVKLLKNGHVLALVYVAKPKQKAEVKDINNVKTGCLYEEDWESHVVFSYCEPTINHDIQKEDNGNYLFIGLEYVKPSLAKQVKGGLVHNPSMPRDVNRPPKKRQKNKPKMTAGFIKEVSPEGKVLWTWHAQDHYDVNKEIISPILPRSEWDHLNTVVVIDQDHLLVNSRSLSETFIVDRKTGDIVARINSGLIYLNQQGSVTISQLRGPVYQGAHDCQLLSSAGGRSLLCFDNSLFNYISRGLELSLDDQYHVTGVVWSTTDNTEKGRQLFSSSMGSIQKLENGNYLLTFADDGVIEEYTPAKELVWQFVRPTAYDHGRLPWGIYRAKRYAPDYAKQFATLALDSA